MVAFFICRRADNCLFAYLAIRDEGRVVLFGQTKRGRPLASGCIEFINSAQMLALDGNAEMRVVPSDHANPDPSNGQDCTREIV